MRAGAKLVRTELILDRDRPRGTPHTPAMIDVHQCDHTVAAAPVYGLPSMTAVDVRVTGTLPAWCGSPGIPATGTAATGTPPARSAAVAEHVVAVLGVADALSLELADAIVVRDGAASPEPSGWLSRIFARYPGCAVAAVSGRGHDDVVGLRDGPVIQFTSSPGTHWWEGGDRDFDGLTATTAGATYASFIYAWVAGRQRLTCLECATIRVFGGRGAGCVRFICRVHQPL